MANLQELTSHYVKDITSSFRHPGEKLITFLFVSIRMIFDRIWPTQIRPTNHWGSVHSTGRVLTVAGQFGGNSVSWICYVMLLGQEEDKAQPQSPGYLMCQLIGQYYTPWNGNG